MPADIPHEWTALCALALMLGARHGFDADHLATIDGLTRFNARERPALARFCGTLFSLGHGMVVVAIALTVSLLAARWEPPEWLETSGTLISVAFLVALGLLNMYAVMRAAPDELVQPVGLRGRWLGGLGRARHPGVVMLVGGLFALSFDTVSQAMLFALAAERFGGWQPALMLALLFMLGMLCADGANGLWISRLLRRADDVAIAASRVMGLVVATLSLAVAAFGVAKLSIPAVGAWSEGRETLLGAVVVCAIGASFLLAVSSSRKPQPATARSAAGADL